MSETPGHVQETSMESLFGRFVKDESGATAIEYAFIAVLIAVVLVTALRRSVLNS